MNWKEVVRELSEEFEDLDAVAVPFEGEELLEGGIVDLSPSPLEVGGRGFSRREVRGWLWELRKSRAVQRTNGVVWAVYDSSKDSTYVGVGAVVDLETLGRFASMYPERLTTEV